MDITVTTPTNLTKNDTVQEPADPKRLNTKSLSFTNGVLKRLRHHTVSPTSPTATVVYKECLKNHAAALGGHALDGCGEFMPCVTSNPNLPITMKCAACGCHRNFHRRQPEETTAALQILTPSPAIEYRSPHPPSPPPISSSYYPASAPRMLLGLSTGGMQRENMERTVGDQLVVSGGGRKRFRTKFSSVQKEKMYEVAERVGWKMMKKDEEIVNELCNGIGVGREVFKVWMHNNKSTFNKRSSVDNGSGNIGEVNALEQHGLLSHDDMNGGDIDRIQHQLHRHHSEGNGGHVTTNGSFSST